MIIKVCGMREAENIRAVEALGVDMMGFIFHPASPRYVQERPAYLPRRCRRVGVFVNADTPDILQTADRFGLHLVQLHGCEPPALCADLRSHGLGVIKAIGIRSAVDAAQAASYCPHCDFLLFDTACREHGGSGCTFDHTLLQAYTGNTPFLLSGGIGANTPIPLHPLLCGIDLNSRFELRPALKNITLLSSFINTLHTSPS